MKRMIKADSDVQIYDVTVNFGGFVGADEVYSVDASSIEDAEEYAIEEAKDDLYVEEIEEVDDGEYEVTIGWNGMVGVAQCYTVHADDEEEAEEYALEAAADDLSAEVETI